MTATLDIVIANERGIAVPYNIEESVSNPLDCISHQLGYSTSTSNETKIPKAMVAKPKTACVISSVIHKGLKRPAERILAVPDAIHYMGNLEVSVVIIYKHAARGEYPVNMSMDMRFIKSSDQIMPYVHNRDPGTIFCTLEILSAAKTKGFGDFSAMLTQHWISGYKVSKQDRS
ncbi:hypothetical protein BG015_001462 [Linnemannia schmuckeri]|uniref:Uncharacterized protein n=1 Tax=Linnemannia schmuckeri TaxID=64567 RepID=A0A9P5V6G5_9FUNG|nr:hypothetical protein BG015_001462 [Linnemannia schmuckeri]